MRAISMKLELMINRAYGDAIITAVRSTSKQTLRLTDR